MQTWLSIDEFAKTVSRELPEIEVMCEENKLVSKIEKGIRYVETASATQVLLPHEVKGKEVYEDYID